MPDRLPSLIVLVGFWIPPAVAGWMAAGSLHRSTNGRAHEHEHQHRRSKVTHVLAALVMAYAAVWFLFNLDRMPPYIPGAPRDPTPSPPPRAVVGLALFTGGLVLPGSALACALAFRNRLRMLSRPSP
jgi:hypothetical protein